MEKGNIFNYKWTLKDANFTKDRGKVFSCFACGGGSTMGYKLAGFDVIASFFNEVFVKENEVVPTIRAKAELPLFSKPILMSNTEIIKSSSFPLDYNFGKENVCYVCGMSVPPIMMAHVANNIYQQWLSKL